MVDTDASLPLPWLDEPLERALRQGAHALLLHGPEGIGQFELGLTLAKAWLCEGTADRRSHGAGCGVCRSCHLVAARSHPDLLVLIPELLRESLGWASAGEGEEGGSEKVSKAKPSKEIKVEAVRAAVSFAQTTSARGRGKVLVLHPAERMNAIAANTLLKTLEEPPGSARFVLSSAAPDSLLPTIRSRCQALRLALPPQDVAAAWLSARGVNDASALLAACGGKPLQALEWHEEGIDAKLWPKIPALLARGDALPFMAWPLPRLVETLQKVCHDVLSVSAGAAPRYFPEGSVRAAGIDALGTWWRDLQRIAEHAEHPWSAGLMVEALVDSARKALSEPAVSGRRSGVKSVHLPA
ncbi:MAG: DNA polymerase III subunit delta' [Caldimonas sp.]